MKRALEQETYRIGLLCIRSSSTYLSIMVTLGTKNLCQAVDNSK